MEEEERSKVGMQQNLERFGRVNYIFSLIKTKDKNPYSPKYFVLFRAGSGEVFTALKKELEFRTPPELLFS